MPYKTIVVEKKHTYQNFDLPFNYGIATTDSCVVFKPKYPETQGVTVSSRIGDKITPTSMVLDMVVQHPYLQGSPFSNETYSIGYSYSTSTNSVPNTLTGYKPNHDWFSQFRLFLITVDPDSILAETSALAKVWFQENFVPYVYPDDEPVVVGQWNNQTDLKRESTEDTGNFQILWEHKFTLTNKHPSQHIVHTFPMKGVLTFPNPADDPAADQTVPSNRKYLFILMGPLNYINFDYSLMQEFSTTGVQASAKGVLKLNYMDD